jgi:adenylate cyclase
VAFVDLAGFVALTEAHGAATAADFAARFAALAGRVVPPPARVVKTIGDAVMLAAPDPDSGLRAAVAVLEGCLAEPGFPIARGGIDHGEVVERDGDVFGPAVNLAARLTSYAAGPQLLLTERIADAARRAGHAPESFGPVRLRNIAQPVDVHAITLADPSVAVVDPVCRMRLEPKTAVGRLRHGEREYWFCSRECVAAFAAHPDAYLPAP